MAYHGHMHDAESEVVCGLGEGGVGGDRHDHLRRCEVGPLLAGMIPAHHKIA